MRLASRWLGFLCLLLMLWTAAAEPLHHHPGKAASSGCSLCVVAHSATPTANLNNDRPVLVAVGFLHTDVVRTQTLLATLDLGIRGPPAI